jgi:DNA-binding transcriptional LysR family regulator
MELRHLEHFVAVAEERSFTRASRRVHLVQSALSVSIRALERELGTRLFDRTTHQVELTDTGLAFLPEARRTLAAAERARDAVAAVKGVIRGTLRIGLMQSLTVVDVASLLARFHLLHPGVEIRPRPALGGSAALADEVRRGQLDVAFLSLPGDPLPGLSATLLATEPLLLACAPGQLPDAPMELELVALDGATFVDFPLGWGSRTAVDLAFAAAGIERTVPVEVADVTTFVELVRAGLGLGFLPRSLLEGRKPGLEIRSIIPSPSWDVVMAIPTGHEPTAATRAFLEIASTDLDEVISP